MRWEAYFSSSQNSEGTQLLHTITGTQSVLSQHSTIPTMLPSPIFILVACLFFLNTFISLKELNLIKFKAPIETHKLGLYTSVGILVISIAGGIAFEVMLSESGATDWWFNSGYYAGLIGGISMTTLYYLSIRNLSTQTK